MADTSIPQPGLRPARPATPAAALLPTCLWTCLWAGLWAGLAPLAQAGVEARLSPHEVAAGAPVELELVQGVDGGPQGAAAPDLSVLESDFEILDRRIERRVSVTDGRRREETRLKLLLLPRRGGTIQIPAVPFGDERTAALSLKVTGEPLQTQSRDAQGDTQAPPWGPDQGQPAWGGVPRRWGAAPEGLGLGAPQSGRWTAFGAEPFAAGPGVQRPEGSELAHPSADLRYDRMKVAEQGPAAAGLSAGRDRDCEAQPASLPAADSHSRHSDPWFWTSLVLAVLLTAALVRRGTRPGTEGVAQQPQPPGGTQAPDPLGSAEEAVRWAYARGDGGAARDALLAWGRLRWPLDPPNNLARLAQRCQPPLKEHITDLERAFFSPRPIDWDAAPVADLLATHRAPARAQGTVASRGAQGPGAAPVSGDLPSDSAPTDGAPPTGPIV